jgi:serine/threonine protein kinase
VSFLQFNELKAIIPPFRVSKAGAESVAQEIDLLRRVGHPNVVSLLYYFRLKTDNEVSLFYD